METTLRYRGKRRKGGQQQRLAKVEREHESSSALYALLMTWLAKGILSGVQVHQLAVAAKKDIAGAVEGLQYNDLAKLAQLLHGKNLVKSVHALMARVSPLPSPLQVPLPYKDGLHDAYILLPHEIFAYMLEHQKVWKAKFLADPTRLKDFWKSMQGHPALRKHPLLDRPGYENWCVPYLHSWRRSAMLWHWENLESICAKLLMVLHCPKLPRRCMLTNHALHLCTLRKICLPLNRSNGRNNGNLLQGAFLVIECNVGRKMARKGLDREILCGKYG